MASFNKVILCGRLTADPETKSVGSGGKLCAFRFAVTNRKKTASGWQDDPCYIDCEVWNRGESGKLADLVADRCRKGSQILIEGRLHLDQWEDKNGGGKRNKHKLVLDVVQLLDSRPANQDQQPTRQQEDGHAPIQDDPDGEIPF